MSLLAKIEAFNPLPSSQIDPKQMEDQGGQCGERGRSDAEGVDVDDAETLRDACVTEQTRGKYTSSINGIKKWIQTELVKSDINADRLIDSSGQIDLNNFSPGYFEKFLVYKRCMVKTVTLGGYRSAIKDLYRVKRMPLPAEYGDSMKQLFSGMKRKEAAHDQSSNPRNSGKKPLPYSVYKSLCESTLSLSDGGFAHLFLTSQWNLMCRSISVQTLQSHHLIAEDDSIGVVFYKTKTNQEGAGPKDPRHIYANRMSPSTCWITALGLYLACHPRIQPGSVFPGANQKLRFGKALSGLLKTSGLSDGYGTHSVRKGVATFACGGSTGGPSVVSVCLHCGWSLGGVQDRYFRYEAAGDQFLGRVVAGLPLNDAKFASLPPHFAFDNDALVDKCVKTMFPSLETDLNMHKILHLCLASLVYHADYLVDILPKEHPLLATTVFSNPSLMAALSSRVLTENSTWIRPTGIPPYIEVYKKFDRQQQSINALPDILEARVSKVIEEKGVAAGHVTAATLRSVLSSVLAEVGLRQADTTHNVFLPTNTRRDLHFWGGKFHILPKDFSFPSIDPLGAWQLWWFGNSKRNYPPYKGIQTDDLDSSQKKATYSEWSIMMRHIIAGVEATTGSEIGKICDEVHAIELFNIGFQQLKLKPSKHKRRIDQLKLTTVLRLVRENLNDTAGSKKTPFRSRKRPKRTICNDKPLPIIPCSRHIPSILDNAGQ